MCDSINLSLLGLESLRIDLGPELRRVSDPWWLIRDLVSDLYGLEAFLCEYLRELINVPKGMRSGAKNKPEKRNDKRMKKKIEEDCFESSSLTGKLILCYRFLCSLSRHTAPRGTLHWPTSGR